jgi:hypothetical protein
MARIINTVGSLSVLKKELEKRGISQFHSIKDINEFERTYVQQLEDVKCEIRSKLISETESISADMDRLNSVIGSKHAKAEEDVNEKILQVNNHIKSLENRKNNALQRAATHILVSSLRRKVRQVEKRRFAHIEASIKHERVEQKLLEERLDELKNNFDEIAAREFDRRIEGLRYAKASVDELPDHSWLYW